MIVQAALVDPATTELLDSLVDPDGLDHPERTPSTAPALVDPSSSTRSRSNDLFLLILSPTLQFPGTHTWYSKGNRIQAC